VNQITVQRTFTQSGWKRRRWRGNLWDYSAPGDPFNGTGSSFRWKSECAAVDHSHLTKVRRLGSVCTGAFLSAESGCHWGSAVGIHSCDVGRYI